MPKQSADQRYEDILARIAARRPFGSAPKKAEAKRPHDRALDLVNAYDALADLVERDYANILCHGPRTLRGAAWSGVVIWYHGKGYHGYQRLTLLGVWAQYEGSDILLSAGIRKLAYRAPVYDPGVYRVAITNGFELYYEDKGQPPGEEDRLLFHAKFAASARLTLRDELQAIANDWRRKQSSP